LFPFGGVMLAVVLGVSLLDALLAVGRAQRQIEHQVNEVAKTLRDASFPLTDAVLTQTRGLSGAEFVLTDQQGTVRAASLADVELASIPRAAHGLEFHLGDTIPRQCGNFAAAIGQAMSASCVMPWNTGHCWRAADESRSNICLRPWMANARDRWPDNSMRRFARGRGSNWQTARSKASFTTSF
jgi:hypothetical protein